MNKDLISKTLKFYNLSTKENPLVFFEDLIFKNSQINLRESFKKETVVTEGYYYVLEIKKDFYFEAWINKEDITDIINYDSYLDKVYNYNTLLTIDSLDKNLKSEKEGNALFIKKQLDILNACYDKLYHNDYTKNIEEKIKNKLNDLVNHLKFKYSYLEVCHKVYNRTKDDEPISSMFQCKPELKKSHFVKLYTLTIRLDLIDDIEIDETTFLDVLLSPKPSQDSKIVFTKANIIVANYLKLLEPLFNNFNAMSIEKSKMFFNKQGKPIKSGDLYTALSRNNGKNKDFINQIQTSLIALTSTF